jgi:putative FmdB family regulatory protein
VPSYEYHCEACKATFTRTLTVKEHHEKKVRCPKCGSLRVTRVVSRFFALTSRKS